MRRNLVIVLAAVAGLAAATARAELVVVPLDLGETPLDLRGEERVEVPFDAGRSLAGATSVALRVVGSGRFERSVCWQFGDYGGGVWFYREDVGVVAALSVAGEVRAETSLVVASADHPDLDQTAFDATMVLAASDWSFLADGRGTVVLEGLDCEHFAHHPEVCICDPSAALTGASLIVALDGEVPTSRRAWGALKACYR